MFKEKSKRFAPGRCVLSINEYVHFPWCALWEVLGILEHLRMCRVQHSLDTPWSMIPMQLLGARRELERERERTYRS